MHSVNWVELSFNAVLEPFGGIFFVLLYSLGLIASHSITFFKHRGDPHYNSLGASGAVSAVLFSAVLLFPTEQISFIFLPGIGIPSYLFGILYLVYCQYMTRRGGGNINHDAHFAGAVFGFLFTGLLRPSFFINFVQQIMP